MSSAPVHLKIIASAIIVCSSFRVAKLASCTTYLWSIYSPSPVRNLLHMLQSHYPPPKKKKSVYLCSLYHASSLINLVPMIQSHCPKNDFVHPSPEWLLNISFPFQFENDFLAPITNPISDSRFVEQILSQCFLSLSLFLRSISLSLVVSPSVLSIFQQYRSFWFLFLLPIPMYFHSFFLNFFNYFVSLSRSVIISLSLSLLLL